MKLYVITGASRGLGAALAEALIDPDHHLICFARSAAPLAELALRAASRGCVVEACSGDLADTATAVATLERHLAALKAQDCSEACLINNAAAIEPIRPAERLRAAEIAASIAVNATAPLALCATFLQVTSSWSALRKVLNISTGAARHPYAGWSVYCAAKAALDQFSRCVAEEQRQAANPARIVSLAPGVVDTEMQATIRGTSPQDFKDLQRFLDLKSDGRLTPPSEAARLILQYLNSADFGSQTIADIRDL